MGVYSDVRHVFEYTLANTSGLPTSIAWENIQFTPATGTPYLSTLLLPTYRRPAVRGLSPQQRYQGLFQVNIFVPHQAGPSVADGYAETILSTFNATTDLTYNSVTVPIEYAERTQGMVKEPWYHVVCNIGWYYYN